MLTAVVRIALALEILLVCIEGVVSGAHTYLPLGNSHLAQLGLVLGLAVVVVELWESMFGGKARPPSAPAHIGTDLRNEKTQPNQRPRSVP